MCGDKADLDALGGVHVSLYTSSLLIALLPQSAKSPLTSATVLSIAPVIPPSFPSRLPDCQIAAEIVRLLVGLLESTAWVPWSNLIRCPCTHVCFAARAAAFCA